MATFSNFSSTFPLNSFQEKAAFKNLVKCFVYILQIGYQGLLHYFTDLCGNIFAKEF